MVGGSAASASGGAATAGRLAAQPGRAPARQAASPACPWLSQSLSVSARVKLLMAQMTLANKITVVEGQGTSELISAVAAANPHTVVVIDAGAPVAMPWIHQVAGVVDAWYPGESNGTALASVLYGGTDPSGHLPVTFPQDLSQVLAATPAQFPGVDGQVDYSEGLDVGYRWYDTKSITPLFPFGYGLSYTRFSYSHLRVRTASQRSQAAGSRAASGQAAAQVRVSALVTNTGQAAGADIAQLYLGDPAVAGEPPRQLKGFRKVTLRPGQSARVSFLLDGHDLSYWNDAADGWVIPAGAFRVYLGDSSALADLPLQGSFTVTGSASGR